MLTFFLMLCMLSIGFLAGIIATVAFVAYLETRPDTDEPQETDGYMSKINTPEGQRYHAQKH